MKHFTYLETYLPNARGLAAFLDKEVGKGEGFYKNDSVERNWQVIHVEKSGDADHRGYFRYIITLGA